ncbi:hypothetical protein KIN20_008557 [Parelaphostrongylus tenuis]|uniref:Uncharacterized protein n=1 Tax=Parelaphostrongylus tenuis TaxID=148309 RepID=A0AAD5M4X7_PARTN|nr:hypothetical protein KIN20_008557 [Parelaphostrongylus tenuis]
MSSDESDDDYQEQRGRRGGRRRGEQPVRFRRTLQRVKMTRRRRRLRRERSTQRVKRNQKVIVRNNSGGLSQKVEKVEEATQGSSAAWIRFHFARCRC